MVGQGCATCHDEAHMAPQPGLDLAEHQLVKEWGRLQSAAEVYRLSSKYNQDDHGTMNL